MNLNTYLDRLVGATPVKTDRGLLAHNREFLSNGPGRADLSSSPSYTTTRADLAQAAAEASPNGFGKTRDVWANDVGLAFSGGRGSFVAPSVVRSIVRRPSRNVLLPLANVVEVSVGMEGQSGDYKIGHEETPITRDLAEPLSYPETGDLNTLDLDYGASSIHLEMFGVRRRVLETWLADATPAGLAELRDSIVSALLSSVEARAFKSATDSVIGGVLDLPRVALNSWTKHSDGVRSIRLSSADFPAPTGSVQPEDAVISALLALPEHAMAAGGSILLPPTPYASLVSKMNRLGTAPLESSNVRPGLYGFTIRKAEMMPEPSAAGEAVALVVPRGSFHLGVRPGFPVEMRWANRHLDTHSILRVITEAGVVWSSTEQVVVIERG